MGSCTHIVDDRKILNQYEYDVWGNVVSQKETIKNRFKFNGQQLDPITQQYYLRARFYNPVIGRFTQEDTYRGDGLNLYVYCDNNPIYYVDPSGNTCVPAKDTLANATNSSKPMTWNEFQSANKNKYTNSQMSEEWSKYKQANYPNGGEHYLIRPYLRQETIDGITRGKNLDGTYFDANTFEPIEGTPDIGHRYGHEFWRERNKAESLGWTQSQFNDYMNNSDFYQYEDPKSNRSHKYEMK